MVLLLLRTFLAVVAFFSWNSDMFKILTFHPLSLASAACGPRVEDSDLEFSQDDICHEFYLCHSSSPVSTHTGELE